MRLFIAVPLPVDLAAAASAILPERPALRRVKPELMHVTLAFLGAVPEERLPDVIAAAREGAAPHGAIAVTFDAVGRFPKSGPPRVAWLGMGEGALEMGAVAEHVRAALASKGVPYDEKPFRPHLTLARVRETADREELREIASVVEAATVAPLRFTADAVHVIESHLSSKGPRYTSRANVRLRVGGKA